MKYIKVLIFIISVMSLFSSCSEYYRSADKEMGTGYSLTPSDVTQIVESQREAEKKFVIDENTKYYWAKGGSKFHLFKDCQSMSRTDPEDIVVGTLQAAREAGKDSPCSFCLKRGHLEQNDFLEKNP